MSLHPGTPATTIASRAQKGPGGPSRWLCPSDGQHTSSDLRRRTTRRSPSVASKRRTTSRQFREQYPDIEVELYVHRVGSPAGAASTWLKASSTTTSSLSTMYYVTTSVRPCAGT